MDRERAAAPWQPQRLLKRGRRLRQFPAAAWGHRRKLNVAAFAFRDLLQAVIPVRVSARKANNQKLGHLLTSRTLLWVRHRIVARMLTQGASASRPCGC